MKPVMISTRNVPSMNAKIPLKKHESSELDAYRRTFWWQHMLLYIMYWIGIRKS